MAGVNRHYRDVKSALRKKNWVDPYFTARYSFSPYMACEHACKYCDGRAERYYVEGDYEKDIIIRSNLPAILELELAKVKEIGPVSIGSGISDPYQPVEAEEMIMRRCGEILLKTDLPASILTKSALALRDLDIWSELNRKNGFLLMVSITTLKDEIRQIFEPGASPVAERLDLLAQFKTAGIPIGALVMPLLPRITDQSKDIENLIKELKNLGIDFILPGGLTLRPGRQKAVYMDIIKKYYPRLIDYYQNIYANELPSGSPIRTFSNDLYNRVDEFLKRYKIPQQIPHYIYQNCFTLYDEIYVLLNHMVQLYNYAGINTTPLKIAVKRYSSWLKEERKFYLRKRKQSTNRLEETFVNLVKSDQINGIIGNQKLSAFIKKVVLERKKFDYINLNLY